MPEVKWVGTWENNRSRYAYSPVITLDDIEAWLKGQFSVHHSTNLLALRDHLLAQVQAMKEGRTWAR